MTLTRPLMFDKDHRRFLTWTGCGRYHGFYLRPLSAALRPFDADGGSSGFGLFDVAAFEYAPDVRWPVALGDGAFSGKVKSLSPGRYRLYLFGEGSCQVRAPVASGVRGAWRLTTARAATVQYGESPLDHTGTPKAGPHVGAASLPVTLRENTYALAVTHTWDHDRGIQDVTIGNGATACIDELPYGTCAPKHPDDRDSHIAVEGHESRNGDGTTHTTVNASYFFLPGDAPSGQMYAKATAQNTTSEWSAHAAVLAFDV